MDRHLLLRSLAQRTESKIVLLVLDGLGDIRTASQPRTALELARTPNVDALAARSALGRLQPATPGITPGSGPGHLALFGQDPLAPETDIGRGVLEALGLGLAVDAATVCVRANFATVAADGTLTDRRAGRIPTAEGERLCALLNAALPAAAAGSGLAVSLHAGEGYRFVVLVRANEPGLTLGAGVGDSDPQRLGSPPLPLRALPGAEDGSHQLARRLQLVIDRLLPLLAAEPKANTFLLRGVSTLPRLPRFQDLYQLRAACFAGYPLYRGVASLCGMEVVPSGKRFADLLDALAPRWSQFDFFFLHVKQTDQAGEDGDLAAKVAVIEEVDAALPRLLALRPEVVAITADHSTPVPLRAHSWHPVPLLLAGPHCFVDDTQRFTELEAARGVLGTHPAAELIGLLLANAGKLLKFGA